MSPLLEMLAHGPFSLADLEARLFNRLQASARDTHPELAHFLDEATRCTGRRVHLTGSGSASFLLVQEDSEASMLQTSLAKLPGLRTLQARMVALDRPSV